MSRETDYNIFRAIRGARDEVCGGKRWGGGVVGYGGRILTKNMALHIARFVRRP